jgi:hypothetical protein
MGEYEDLLEKAKSGDDSAFEELKKFSGSALREKAEKADTLEKRVKELEPLAREATFNKLRAELPEDLSGVDLSLNDLGSNELSVEVLIEKAKSKQEREKSSLADTAKELGFDSVEEYQSALEAMKQEQAKKRASMEATGKTASGGGEPPSDEPSEPFGAMKQDYEEARSSGMPHDKAMGEGVHGLMAAQKPVDVE